MVANDNTFNNLFCNIRDIDTLSHALNYICSFKLNYPKANITSDELRLFSDMSNTNRYYSFSIPKKKKGQFRQISAPVDRLKDILRSVNHLISFQYHPQAYVTGFVNGASVVTNASMHVCQPFIYNVDLKHFFDSIYAEMVIDRLRRPPYNYSLEVAEVIAKMSSIKDPNTGRIHLAQGAPSSPIISNIICESLDRDLFALGNQFGVKYSRYADDITFSSSRNIYRYNGEFYRSLNKIIENHSFEINHDKVRIRGRQQRQEVTGLIVNQKVNVSRAFIKDIRNLLYIWEKYGAQHAYWRFYSKCMKSKDFILKNKYVPFFVDSLRGKLNYLALVKGINDPTYIKLNQKFISLNKGNYKNFSNTSYRKIRQFVKYEGSIVFNLDEPIIDKYGRSYYVATSPVPGGKIIISPRLTPLIDLKPRNLQYILHDKCSMHLIFDRDGVKWVMAERANSHITKAINDALEEDQKMKDRARRAEIEEQERLQKKREAEFPSIKRRTMDDTISCSSYPYLVKCYTLLDYDEGIERSEEFIYCCSFEAAKSAFRSYLESIPQSAEIKLDPNNLSEQDYLKVFWHEKYNSTWCCKIERR